MLQDGVRAVAHPLLERRDPFTHNDVKTVNLACANIVEWRSSSNNNLKAFLLLLFAHAVGSLRMLAPQAARVESIPSLQGLVSTSGASTTLPNSNPIMREKLLPPTKYSI